MRYVALFIVILLVAFVGERYVDRQLAEADREWSEELSETIIGLRRGLEADQNEIESAIATSSSQLEELALLVTSMADQRAVKSQADRRVGTTIEELKNNDDSDGLTDEDAEDLDPRDGEDADSYRERTTSIVNKGMEEAEDRLRRRAESETDPQYKQQFETIAECMENSRGRVPDEVDEANAKNILQATRDCQAAISSLKKQVESDIEKNRTEYERLECDEQPVEANESRCSELEEEHKRLQDRKKDIDHAALMMKMFMMWLGVVLILSGQPAIGMWMIMMANSSGGEGDGDGDDEPCEGSQCRDDETTGGESVGEQEPQKPDPEPRQFSGIPGSGGSVDLSAEDDGLYRVDGESREMLFRYDLPGHLDSTAFGGLNRASFSESTTCDVLAAGALMCRSLRVGNQTFDHLKLLFNADELTDIRKQECGVYRDELRQMGIEITFDCTP